MRKRRHRGGCLTFLLILAVFAGLLYYWTQHIVVEETELHFASLPESFDGYRVAVVSDLHAAEFGADNKKLFAAVRKADPDIIALTGDITDSPGQVDGVIKTVEGLLKIAPVYYVTGNHEWEKGEVQELFRRLPEIGVTMMRNQVLAIERGGESIFLVGLEDPNGPADMLTPEQVFDRLPGGDEFVLTLVHRNTKLDEPAFLGADLILCGHGHGGLIRLPFLGGLIDHDLSLFPDFTGGVYTIGKTTIVVSRGVGNNTGVPRIGNNPHIPVVVLRSER